MTEVLDVARVAEIDLRLNVGRQIVRTRDGRVFSTNRAPSIWLCDIQTAPMARDKAAEVLALLQEIEETGGDFAAHDARHPLPANASSAASNTSNAVLEAVGPDNNKVRLSGLPADYIVTAGDYLAFNHPSGRMLHRFTENHTADGAGETTLINVVPLVMPGADTGVGVDLKQSSARFAVVPGSIQSVDVQRVTQAISWSGVQVFNGD